MCKHIKVITTNEIVFCNNFMMVREKSMSVYYYNIKIVIVMFSLIMVIELSGVKFGLKSYA